MNFHTKDWHLDYTVFIYGIKRRIKRRFIDAVKLKHNIEEIAKYDLDNNNVFCSSYSVWQNESIAFKEHFGYADYTENKKVDDNTIYRLASMTKPITAVAILILVDRGLISLNDSISKSNTTI